MRHSLALAVAAVAVSATLAACSSDDSSSEGEMVGGMTECTDEIINAEAEKVVDANSGGENVWSPMTVECADGWAVASGSIDIKAAPADGPQGAPASLIFEQEGQFWIPKDKQDVCGTIDGDTYPSDAQVPEALFLAGCLSG
jgi:hypothetical protein